MPKLSKISNSIQSIEKNEGQNISNVYTDDQLLLNKPYYCYLSELDNRLLYLHLIDYGKFYHKIES